MKTYNFDVHGITFSYSCEEMLNPQAQALFQSIMAIPPEKLKNGFKIQIGFSLYILNQTPDGYKIVVPDYEGNPFSETSEDLTIAFWIQLEQTDLLREYNILSPESVRFDEKVVVAKDALQNKMINLQRFSDLGESGWCIEAIEQDENGELYNATANGYDSYYIYQLLNIRPGVIKALAFPFDYLIVFDEDNIVEILNEQNESIMIED